MILIAFALLSGMGGGLLTWLVIRTVVDRAALHEIGPTFWALIVGMGAAAVSLLLLASILLVEVLAVD